MYSYEEVKEETLKYFEGDETATDVWINKYALRDEVGNLHEKNPNDMHLRFAREFARIEKNKFENPLTEDQLFNYFKGFNRIVLQGSPSFGVGNPYALVSLSNCYVVECPLDSYAGIMRTDMIMAQISKRRGGVGTDLSNIRPNKTPTKNASRTSTGIIPFARRYSNTIREIGQDGRRGALMLCLDVHHPEAVIVNEDAWENPLPITIAGDPQLGFRDIVTDNRYYDENVSDFVSAKLNRKDITGANISVRVTNEFMQAAKYGGIFEQRFPVDYKKTGAKPLISRNTDARKAWLKIIHSAWQSAEPGILFWDRVINYNAVDCYAEYGYETVATNPCLHGDTLVYVADGRGNIPIRQLAEEGNDVDVFCFDSTNKITISRMRNPRVTGHKEPIFKITLDDGSCVRVTKNHKFMLLNGSYVEAQNLKAGDSLKVIHKFEASIKDLFPNANSRSQDYYWLNAGQVINWSEHRFIAERNHGVILKGYVVHHKDFNAKNNHPDNLQIMSKYDHDQLHGQLMMGDNNPMRRAKYEWSEEKWADYRAKQSTNCTGSGNPRYHDITNEELQEHAIKLTKSLNHRFSDTDWYAYAKENNIPSAISKFRAKEIGNLYQLSVWAAQQLEMDNIDCDVRVLRSRQSMIDQGYVCHIINKRLFVEKICESCGNIFKIDHRQREQSFCGQQCAWTYVNKVHHDDRIRGLHEAHANRKEIIREQQAIVYNDLKFALNREPMKKEWIEQCTTNGVSFEISRTSSPFTSFDALKEYAGKLNHKVASVEQDGFDTVYNGTVDHHHNFFIGGFESRTKNDKTQWTYLNNRQCGELPLCVNDSCRLLIQNLFGYVINPFREDAYFDFEAFFEESKIAQRLMDDLIDLELEAIDKIIAKINSDNEPDYLKRDELDLWKAIREKCFNGRRTGLGTTGMGDVLAALGIKYGSDESIEFVEKVHRHQKFGALISSIQMSMLVGPFPIWNWDLEKDCEFYRQMIDSNESIQIGDITYTAEFVLDHIKQYGRRNIGWLTQAPVGSLSCLTRTTSSGESVYDITPYTRRRKINPSDTHARVDFIDQNGDKWQEYTVYHPKLKMWMDVTGKTDYKESPWWGCCANDIDWVNSVRMQAAAQRHIDHAISRTVNLPESATEEDVANVYMTAWEAGCKGITVYRDKCRTGVLVRKEDKPKPSSGNAPKRPTDLPCDVYKVTVKGAQYNVIVGLNNDEPYEVMVACGDHPELSKIKSGILRKKSRGHYQLLLGDEMIIDNVTESCNPGEDALTRMTSAALRHGVPLKFLLEQLSKSKDSINSFAKAISRCLKKYVSEDEISNVECPNCGEAMRFTEGCLSCVCGYSKC